MNKCLHCDTHTPKYCEECYQELISKNTKLQVTLNKLKDKMIADKMEQFDDYIIYLLENYLDILGE